MEINTAISTLESLSNNINSQIDGLTAQKEALQVSLNQLKGVLVVQSAELENKYQTQISDLQTANANLSSDLTAKQTEIDELKIATAVLPTSPTDTPII